MRYIELDINDSHVISKIDMIASVGEFLLRTLLFEQLCRLLQPRTGYSRGRGGGRHQPNVIIVMGQLSMESFVERRNTTGSDVIDSSEACEHLLPVTYLI